MKTLRGRMVLTLLGLAALTLVVTGIAGVLILRHYQTGRLDNEVTRLSQLASRPFFADGRPRTPDSKDPGSRRGAPFQPYFVPSPAPPLRPPTLPGLRPTLLCPPPTAPCLLPTPLHH